MNFDNLGLHSEILKAVADAGYTKPTEVQLQVIPKVIKIAKIEAYSIILFLGNLSAKKPDGENIKIKGRSIKAFTIVVRIISVPPS